jgi:hypothetical protein
VPVILNAGGSALGYAASRRPDLVVPDADGRPAADPAVGEALLRLGAAAVAIPWPGRVAVVTKAGRWNASLDGPGEGPPEVTDGTGPESLGALVAGLVPGLLLGWSWPDLLQHAVAVAAAAAPSGDVNLAAYERLVDSVTVRSAG